MNRTCSPLAIRPGTGKKSSIAWSGSTRRSRAAQNGPFEYVAQQVAVHMRHMFDSLVQACATVVDSHADDCTCLLLFLTPCIMSFAHSGRACKPCLCTHLMLASIDLVCRMAFRCVLRWKMRSQTQSGKEWAPSTSTSQYQCTVHPSCKSDTYKL